MTCPDTVADILLEILQSGVVSARAAGWSNLLELATLEADHVHNLPHIVRRYDPESLAYYWRRERPSYVDRYTRLVGSEPKMFAELWQQLERLMPDVQASLPASSTYHARMREVILEIAAERIEGSKE